MVVSSDVCDEPTNPRHAPEGTLGIAGRDMAIRGSAIGHRVLDLDRVLEDAKVGRLDTEDQETQSVAAEDAEWKCYLLGLIDQYYGRELSELEEEYERAKWLRAQSVLRHLNEFGQLLSAAHAFFIELTNAGGQITLGERAQLQPASESERPSSLVQFQPANPPDPPPLDPVEYERQMGGPHVLGARLLWWCAAAKSPEPFGFTPGFSHKLWTQPIWTLNQDRNVRANPRVVPLLQHAASHVCDVLQREAMEDLQTATTPQTPPNGPEPPNRFWWNGRHVTLSRRPRDLLYYMWNHRTAEIQTVIEKVWEKTIGDSTLDSTISRVNRVLADAEFPVSITSKLGYLTLSIGET
jgi:hypothetical protein